MMGAFSIWHWLIVLVVVLVLFGGRGKISSLMGDLGKGLKAFKSNLKDDSAKAKAEGITNETTTTTTAREQSGESQEPGSQQ